MISKDAFVSALEEVDNAILAALPEPEECSFQFSERFEKKMSTDKAYKNKHKRNKKLSSGGKI